MRPSIYVSYCPSAGRLRASSKNWRCGTSEPSATPRAKQKAFVQPVEWDTRAVVVQSLILYTTNTI